MNHIVLTANMKGGTGKSLVCSMFATYLAQKGEKVIVIDADLQQSVIGHRQEDLKEYPNAQLPWPVMSIDELGSLDVAMPKLQRLDGWVIIDTPGTLNDNNLIPIFAAADYAIVPISYDGDTIRATSLFCKAFTKMSKAKIIFLPNRINGMEGKEAIDQQRAKAKDALVAYGHVVARIKQSVVVQRYSTVLLLNSYQLNAVCNSFDWIIDIINHKK